MTHSPAALAAPDMHCETRYTAELQQDAKMPGCTMKASMHGLADAVPACAPMLLEAAGMGVPSTQPASMPYSSASACGQPCMHKKAHETESPLY